MKSERSREGYLVIDHRAGPGVSRDELKGFDAPAVEGGKLFESATITCSHCQTLVVLNPDRSRVRERCQKCFKYICDGCAAARKAGAECVPVNKWIDQILSLAAKGEPNG